MSRETLRRAIRIMRVLGRHRPTIRFVGLLFVLCNRVTGAEQPFFVGLGTPPGGYYSRAWGVSGDGSVVVGWQESGALLREAFRWTKSGGRVVLGNGTSTAFGVSDDGSVVVGQGSFGAGTEAYRWTSTLGPLGIGDLPGGAFLSGAVGVSGDGSVVVGTSESASGREAFRWTESEGIVGLGDLPGGIFESTAYKTSVDGSVIVGYGRSEVTPSHPTGRFEAFRWTSASGMEGLGDLPGGDVGSVAKDVSADGSVIVGFSRSGNSFSGGVEAFRWTSGGGMVGLGYVPGEFAHNSIPEAISADGSIIVGAYQTNPVDPESTERAFIWDAAHGMRRLRDVLTNDFGLDLTGWTLRRAKDISADGQTIVGDGYNPQGAEEGWIAHLGSPVPEPSSLGLLGIGFTALANYRRKRQRRERRQTHPRWKHSNHFGAFEFLEHRNLMTADFDAAFAVGGAINESVWDLSMDGAGNTCVVGRFTGNVDFDPGPGVYELTSDASMSSTTFAAKYDPSGNLLWAQRISGTAANFGPEIRAGVDGSVYVVGSFTGTADFGSRTLTSLGDSDAFVIKLDSSGNFVWTQQFGGTRADWGNDVAVDNSGNVYVLAETRTASNGGPDAFVAKLDSDGNVGWTTAVGTSSSIPAKGKQTPSGWARGFKITLDSAVGVYVTGRMDGTVDFDPTSGATRLSGSAFVMKMTAANGSLVWARTFTGNICEPRDIAVDDNGNVYSTGMYYYGGVDFDPGTAKNQVFVLNELGGGILPSATYVSALNSTGNFRWAKSLTVGVEALAIDSAGDLYLTGEFSNTVDFDPGFEVFNLTSAGDVDAFVWKLDTSGNFVWAGQMGGGTADRARGIGVDPAGNIFVAGTFTGTADFDPGPGTYNLTSAGGNDFFVAKLSQSLLLESINAESANADIASSNEPAVDNRLISSDTSIVDAAFADLDEKHFDLLLLLA